MIQTMNSRLVGDDDEISITADVGKMPPPMTSVDDSVMLPHSYQPKDEDVICSWARQNHSHPGNERFRIIIEKYAPLYHQVKTKYQKSEVIANVVAEVRKHSPGGGFVKKDFYSGRWFEIGDEKARDKVGHAIRKAAAELGNSTKRRIFKSKELKLKCRKKRSKLDVTTTASPERLVGRNPTILNDPNAMNLAMPLCMTSRLGSSGMDMGDLRTDRATASFLTPNLSSSLLSSTPTSSLVSSNMATLPPLYFGQNYPNMSSLLGNSSLSTLCDAMAIGQGQDSKSATTSSNNNNNNNLSNSPFFLPTLQRRQLLVDEAQRQQQSMNFLRQANEMSMLTQNSMQHQQLTQNEIDFQRRRVAAVASAAAALGGSNNIGLSSLSHPFLGLSSHGPLLQPSTAAVTAASMTAASMTGVPMGMLDNNLQLLRLQLHQRGATAESLLPHLAGLRESGETDDAMSVHARLHRDQPPL